MVLLLMLCIGVLIVVCAAPSGQTKQSGEVRTRRCPTCGAQATVRGNSWECPWCGDSGLCR